MRATFSPESPLTLRPIGFIRSGKRLKFATRRQATEAAPEDSVLELLPGYEEALHDLDGFSHLWLIWGFHRNPNWRPKVLPPRGPAKRRGVFATRSPHRPNPLGISVVPLLGIEGLQLALGPHDLIDVTPVFDIKPYIAQYDSVPGAAKGWLGEVEAWENQPSEYTVAYSDLAAEQAAWLSEYWEINFTERLVEILSRDPSPHAGRRIKPRAPAQFEIGCGAWRAVFERSEKQIQILALEAGYPRRYLDDPARSDIPDRPAQLAYLDRWPDQPDRAR